jgi:hypothetical protein
MALTSSGKQQTRSIAFDLDMIPWLEDRARRQSVESVSAIVRQLIRAVMDAERERQLRDRIAS